MSNGEASKGLSKLELDKCISELTRASIDTLRNYLRDVFLRKYSNFHQQTRDNIEVLDAVLKRAFPPIKVLQAAELRLQQEVQDLEQVKAVFELLPIDSLVPCLDDARFKGFSCMSLQQHIIKVLDGIQQTLSIPATCIPHAGKSCYRRIVGGYSQAELSKQDAKSHTHVALGPPSLEAPMVQLNYLTGLLESLSRSDATGEITIEGKQRLGKHAIECIKSWLSGLNFAESSESKTIPSEKADKNATGDNATGTPASADPKAPDTAPEKVDYTRMSEAEIITHLVTKDLPEGSPDRARVLNQLHKLSGSSVTSPVLPEVNILLRLVKPSEQGLAGVQIHASTGAFKICCMNWQPGIQNVANRITTASVATNTTLEAFRLAGALEAENLYVKFGSKVNPLVVRFDECFKSK